MNSGAACHITCAEIHPMTEWTLPGTVLPEPASCRGAIFGLFGKNSHIMIPFGIIYRSDGRDRYTLGEDADPLLACLCGKTGGRSRA